MKDGLVGNNFEAGLVVLPMQGTPTLDELREMDLAALHDEALVLSGLSNERASEFFRRQSPDVVHFIVWLPSIPSMFH